MGHRAEIQRHSWKDEDIELWVPRWCPGGAQVALRWHPGGAQVAPRTDLSQCVLLIDHRARRKLGEFRASEGHTECLCDTGPHQGVCYAGVGGERQSNTVQVLVTLPEQQRVSGHRLVDI